MKYQENPSTTGQWDASEYVINRYAEVILARAEALNEIYGPTQEAKDLVHEIRERAFDNYKGSKYEILLKARFKSAKRWNQSYSFAHTITRALRTYSTLH